MSANEYQVVGRSVRRPDLVAKVTGEAQYSVDVAVPGMLHAKAVRSDRAHARILGIDAAEARSQQDVVAVLTADDLAPLFPRFGHIHCDHWILASGKVRHYGEPVALVVAKTPAAADDAASFVRISYEDLPPLISAAEALEPDAPAVHEEGYGSMQGRDLYAHIDSSSHSSSTATGERSVEQPADEKPSNISHTVTLEWGDVDLSLAEASIVVEGETHFPMIYPYAMEPYNALATFASDSLTVVSSTQHPFMVRNDLARIFSLPLSKVRVSVPYVGGGYGSKTYTKVEPLAAVASWATGRPVKLVLDVEESIYTGRQDSAHVRVRSGFDSDGHILARSFEIVLNSGAYADSSPLVLTKAVHRCFGPYRVPNLKVVGTSVYTNTAPGVAYRGFGASLGNLAGETNMDQAAERLGMDPLEIRLMNVVPKGEELLPGKRGLDADIQDDLRMLAESLDKGRHHANYGVGIGCTASDAGDVPISTAQVRLQFDGSIMLLSGSTEIGQGSRSVLAQIAAEEFGVDPRLVHVVQSDTGISPYERTTGASRTTTTVGLAVKRACEDARAKLREMAAEVLSCDVEDVTLTTGAVTGPEGDAMPFHDVVQRWFGGAVGEVTGIGIVRREGQTEQMPTFWEIGVVGVGVQIDPETGYVEVDQLATVADVGRAINPKAVEAQDLGAAVQGLGGALYEELVYDGPQLVNANVVDYRVPRVSDMPRRISSMIAERGDGVGPYGAKGVGEGSLNPMGGAVAAAIARAIGRWPTRLPLTPERVWRLSNGLPEEDE